MNRSELFKLEISDTNSNISDDNTSVYHVTFQYCLDRNYLSNSLGGALFVYTRAAIDVLLAISITAVNAILIFTIQKYRRKYRGTSKLWNSGTSIKFIQMLGISDMMVGLTVPMYLLPHYFCDLNDIVRGTEILCVSKYAISTFAALMSNVSLSFIAFDRLIAIQYTIKYPVIMTNRLCHRMIGGQILSAGVTVSMLFFWNNWTRDSYCDIEDVMPVGYILVLGIIGHGLILVTVVGVHIQLHRKATESVARRSISSTCSSDELRISKVSSNNIKSAKVVSLIAGVYMFCWTPYCIILMARLALGGAHQLADFLFHVFFPLSILHSLISPFIYAWKNSEIRNAIVWSVRRSSVSPQQSKI